MGKINSCESKNISDFWISGSFKTHVAEQTQIAIVTPLIYLINGDEYILSTLTKQFGHVSECMLGFYLLNGLILIQFLICLHLSIKVMMPFKSDANTWSQLREYLFKAEEVKGVFSSKLFIERSNLISFIFIATLYLIFLIISIENVISTLNGCDQIGAKFVFDFGWFCYVIFLSLVPAGLVFLFKSTLFNLKD